MDEPRLSVVVSARNAAGLLPVQLDALVAQVGAPPFEVIVSDNGSTDATRRVAEGYADRLDLHVVDSGQQPGVAHARNAGAAAARAAFVAFCDADDAASPGWVAAMVTGLESDDLVGGPLEVETLSDPAVLEWRFTPPEDELPVAMRFLPYATGANLGVRTAVMCELGGFDPAYQRGHEEVDFAWRAQLAGHTIGFAPDALMHYRLRGSLRDTMRQTFHYGRTYAQLYSRFRNQAIEPTPLKRELRTYAILLRQGARGVRRRESLNGWLCTMSWTAGRLWGDVKHQVRAPL